MKLFPQRGGADQSIIINIRNTDGTPKTDLVFNTAGLTFKIHKFRTAMVTVAVGGGTPPVTLADNLAAHADWGFLHLGDGNYRFDVADSVLAKLSGQGNIDLHSFTVSWSGAAGMKSDSKEIFMTDDADPGAASVSAVGLWEQYEKGDLSTISGAAAISNFSFKLRGGLPLKRMVVDNVAKTITVYKLDNVTVEDVINYTGDITVLQSLET